MFCCLLSLDHSVYVRRDDPAMQSLARFHIAYGFVESATPLVQEDRPVSWSPRVSAVSLSV